MRFSFRLILPITIAATSVIILFALYQAEQEVRNQRVDIQRNAMVLGETLSRTVEPLVVVRSRRDLKALLDRFHQHEHLAGVAIYDVMGTPLASTPSLRWPVAIPPAAVIQAVQEGTAQDQFFRIGGEPTHVLALPLRSETGMIGTIAIFHDVGYISANRRAIWRRALASAGIQTTLIACLTILIIHLSLRKPIRRMAQWLRDQRAGAGPDKTPPQDGIFGPLANEVTQLAASLNRARAVAEEEARLREAGDSVWTPERLRVSVKNKLNGSRLFVVSNREPFEHIRLGNSIIGSVPASGLVTALEPVLRACDGTWVAQSTGDADVEMSDELGRVRLPPEQPQYTLRRVWISKQEEEGFYLGFANEGIWPLCHLAHTRPGFHAEDWTHYVSVNRKFSDTVLDEMEGHDSPAVIVQDYHFALLPRMIKERRPDARVALFWHIPWPNAEAFGICPWETELLGGMLGADLIAFHLQAHCNNFLETVDRALESRIDWERFAVSRSDHVTSVRPNPISVAFTSESASMPETWSLERAALLRDLGIEASFVGLGVDRVDYTKGIPERFGAIERFFERYPSYRGKLTFVQVAAPSRTRIKRYQDLSAEVEHEALRINCRFQSGKWKPIVLLNRHHSHAEIQRYYRAAHFCFVTSLHDGMNLVAKEYVASRVDEQGTLILSRFAGASEELADALIVNPYDTDELADAIHRALEMPPEEARARMQGMRRVVRENNVYRWAANLVHELVAIRLNFSEVADVSQIWAGNSSSGQRFTRHHPSKRPNRSRVVQLSSIVSGTDAGARCSGEMSPDTPTRAGVEELKLHRHSL
jgi:trehalose 6-phosphate synthase